MNIFQFLRILWARKMMILIGAASCLAGGLLVVAALPARWEAQARVMLSTLKPDPITGQVISGAATRTYVDTQTQLIRDYSVAGRVPEQLGWLSDPNLISRYERSAKRSGQDFRHWAAQLIIDRTRPRLLDGSNILEITYTANDPNEARIVVDHLRQDYIDTSLSLRQTDALRNQQWYEKQAQNIRQEMERAQATLAAYEREHGVLMANDKEDIDSAQLRALTQVAQAPISSIAPAGPSSITAQLAELDTRISQEAQRLGPNHPDLQALRARRQSVAELARKESSAQSQAASAAQANAAAMQRAVEAQRARVISKSDKIGKLRELQADVDIRQDQYNKTLARAAELAQEAAAADTGLTPLGPATVGNTPVFPKKPLIVGGALVLGLGMGVLCALLAELLARRLRSADDMRLAINAPLLAVIPQDRLGRLVRGSQGLPSEGLSRELAEA